MRLNTAERRLALERLDALVAERSPIENYKIKRAHAGKSTESRSSLIPRGFLSLKLFQANLNIPPLLVIFTSVLFASVFCFLSSLLISLYFVPLFMVAGLFIPLAYIEGRIQKRSLEFAADYPAMLLATASSMKAGMTAYTALERATELLPTTSMVRKEVETLLRSLREGAPKGVAVANFGASIRQPDLDLFRSALLLVLEHGGRFAPTLHRLATVSNDRSVLIRSALVSTANMRLTANVLLLAAPFMMMIVSSRSENFFQIFREHPISSVIGSLGLVMIAVGYICLRRMSSFRP